MMVPMSSYCVFCEIIARREPATILYEDDNVIVFRNRLNWVPVMLLAVPKQHMEQSELWTSEVITKVAKAAAEQGAAHCAGGFRLLSNFGYDAMQSQPHAHVHIVGGTFLGEYA
jgi:histidine triad (HIT) family protein